MIPEATGAPADERSAIERWIDEAGGPGPFAAQWAAMDPLERQAISYDWATVGRPKQQTPPGEWRTWLVCAGRGFGKTRAGVEFVRSEVQSGRAGRVALVGPTAADVRDTMIEGESGILAMAPPWFRPMYEPSKRRLTWPNGAIATAFSAEEPDRLRGPQHDLFWADEAAAWWNATEAWDMLRFGLRLGASPRGIVTTTPRPVPLLIGDESVRRKGLLHEKTTVKTSGSTYENASNLARAFVADIKDRYEGTRLGRQEIDAEVLTDVPGALWMRDMIRFKERPELRRTVVSIDPATSNTATSDETGIGAAALGIDGRGYVLADRTCRMSPDAWARRAVQLYDETKADAIVVEDNQGGDMVETTIRTADFKGRVIRIHAKQGKKIRAEPVSALYEQGKVSHCAVLLELEDQMCNFTGAGGEPDDRVDWLVHALTEMMIKPAAPTYQPPARPIQPRRV